MELFDEIKTEESTQQQSGYQFRIVLKKNKEEFWKGVTKNDKTRKNIKVDWSNFNDSDEEVEKENPMGNMGNFDMNQFMQNQGQMGGNMGADDDSDDSDDEEHEEHDHQGC